MSSTLPPATPDEEPESSSARGAWQDVGREFETLGASLAAAFRSARDRSENRERVADLQNGLSAMVDEVRRAVDETLVSPQGEQVRAGAARAAESVRDAAEATVQEIRPMLLDALRRVNEELGRVNQRLTEGAAPGSPPEGASERG
jgi:hypothetical protein